MKCQSKMEKKPSESKGRAPSCILPETCSTFSLIKKSVFVFFLSGTILCVLMQGKSEGVPEVPWVAFRSLAEKKWFVDWNSGKAASPGSQEFRFSAKKKKYSKIGLQISGDESKVMSPDSCSVPRAPTAASSEPEGVWETAGVCMGEIAKSRRRETPRRWRSLGTGPAGGLPGPWRDPTFACPVSTRSCVGFHSTDLKAV